MAGSRTVCHSSTSLVSSKLYLLSEKYHTNVWQSQCGSQCISDCMKSSTIALQRATHNAPETVQCLYIDPQRCLRHLKCSVVFSEDLSCGPDGWLIFFGERHRSDFLNPLTQSCAFCHFGLVWLWHMIKRFRIYFKFCSKFLCPLMAPCKVCVTPAILGAAGP